jgi:energy-coupling factor transporter ATP-binding protein EcfA2
LTDSPFWAIILSMKTLSIKRGWQGFYYPDSGEFNALVYIQKIYGCAVSRYIDRRSHDRDIILKYLEDHEATFIHKKVTVAKSNNSFADYYYFYKDNIICLDYNESENQYGLIFTYPSSKVCCKDEFEKSVLAPTTKRISILVKTAYGETEVTPFDVNLPKDLDLALNYGGNFISKHQKIVSQLDQKKSGLILLTGAIGSGKTTYIKYLASIIQDREFIFVPINMANHLSSPELLALLLNKKHSVLILEDAETAVRSREDGDGSAVAQLLNMADGIIGDMLKIAIIVTYNTSRNDIDQALLRKGRLMYEHIFNPLSIEDSNRLLKHIGKDHVATEPMTLADIYFLETETGHQEKIPKARLGF